MTDRAEELARAADRVEQTIHKINGHWWNKRVRPQAPDLRRLVDVIRAQPATPWNSDMSAAPRDGTVVNLWTVFTDWHGRELGEQLDRCRWHDQSSMYVEGWHDQWRNKIEWITDPEKLEPGQCANNGRRVTHWMSRPLPPPPVGGEG